MTQMLNRPATVTSDDLGPAVAAGRVLPRFDAVAAEPPAVSLQREHEAVDALPDCAHTVHAAPETLRAGEQPAPTAFARVSLSEAMCGCPITTPQH